MTKVAIKEQIEFIREDLDSTKVTLQQIKNDTSEECGEAQREFFIDDLQSKIDVLESIEDSLMKLDRIMEVAGSELAVINSLKRVKKIAQSIDNEKVVEQLPEGTEVRVEFVSGSKSEFVDAEILGYEEGKPTILTHFGRIYKGVDPLKVSRKEAVNA